LEPQIAARNPMPLRLVLAFPPPSVRFFNYPFVQMTAQEFDISADWTSLRPSPRLVARLRLPQYSVAVRVSRGPDFLLVRVLLSPFISGNQFGGSRITSSLHDALGREQDCRVPERFVWP